MLGVKQWSRHQEHQLALHSTASVITAVRDLARLETAEYHIERVIDLHDTQSRFYGLWESEDAVLLVAAGDVVAGVDLGGIGQKDVHVEAGRATLLLAAPRVFSTRLDEEHTFVHTRRTDMLAQRNEQLEGRARELALGAFEEAALRGGILRRAQAQAERVLSALVQQLGVRQVIILWR